MVQHMELSFVLKYLRFADFTMIDSVTRAWQGHAAFGRVLLAETRPDILVELGTHRGMSFFTFCQAVVDNVLPTHCYAVDSWKGDDHAGFYDEKIFSEVQRIVTAKYSSFAHLIRAEFDEALEQFSDDSIDILHIDGFHTYSAVRHDFDTWLPKVRAGGIILLHDVNEYQESFGAHKIWDEIAPLAEERYLFRHAHGLGVWRKPGGEALTSPLLAGLLGGDPSVSTIIDRYTTNIAEREIFRLRVAQLESERELSRQETACLLEERERLLDVQKEYARMLHSNSWRLTRPLRALTRAFRTLVSERS